jgi:hypothetical protein
VRILRYILVDLLYNLSLSAFFLFNLKGNGRANLLVSLNIASIAFIFELVLICYYVASLLFDLHNRYIHIVLFSLFYIYANTVAISYSEDIYFHIATITFSITLLYLYNKKEVVSNKQKGNNELEIDK